MTRADIERAALAGTMGTAAADVAGARVKASPLARRLARELGVDLHTVEGTGATGAIRAADVRHAAERPRPAPPTPETAPVEPAPEGAPAGRPPAEAAGAATEPAKRAGAAAKAEAERRREAMRGAIARAMARSKREIPHYYLSTTVDMYAALEWLRARNRKLAVSDRLLPAVLLLKAAARAAERTPGLNGFWIDDHFVPGEAVHLGVAISLKQGGLIAPAIHDAAVLGLDELMSRLKGLVARARTGRLRGAELTEATITVTNLGDQGVEAVHGVIYPPQVALIGFGKIVERPWAVGGLLGVRPLVTATLAADHRATDGYTGGRYLDLVDHLLQHPEELS